MPFGVEDEEVEPSSVEMGDEVRTGFFFSSAPGWCGRQRVKKKQATLQTLNLWDCKLKTNN